MFTKFSLKLFTSSFVMILAKLYGANNMMLSYTTFPTCIVPQNMSPPNTSPLDITQDVSLPDNPQYPPNNSPRHLSTFASWSAELHSPWAACYDVPPLVTKLTGVARGCTTCTCIPQGEKQFFWRNYRGKL